MTWNRRELTFLCNVISMPLPRNLLFKRQPFCPVKLVFWFCLGFLIVFKPGYLWVCRILQTHPVCCVMLIWGVHFSSVFVGGGWWWNDNISLMKLVQFSSGCNLMLVKQRFQLVLYMKTPVLQFVQKVFVVQYWRHDSCCWENLLLISISAFGSPAQHVRCL